MDTCEACRFWNRSCETDPDIIGTGECRRKSPSVNIEFTQGANGFGDALRAKWILTMFDDWCGEYQERVSDDNNNG